MAEIGHIEPVKPTSNQGGFDMLWTSFTLVPDNLYDEEQEDLWLNFLKRQIPRDQEIGKEQITSQHCVCLFEKRKNRDSHIIPYLIRLASDKLQSTVCAIRQADKMAVAVIINSKLQLANIYEAGTKEQMLYWLLRIYEQLNIPKETPLYIQCGEGTKKLLNSHFITSNF